MSIEHLTPDELATYYIGLAVRRQVDQTSASGKDLKAFQDSANGWIDCNQLLQLIDHWLTLEQIFHIFDTTAVFEAPSKIEPPRAQRRGRRAG